VLVLPWRAPGVVGRWDLAASKELYSLERAQSVVDHCSFSPGGRYLAVVGSDERPGVGNVFSIRVWDTVTGRRLPYFDTIDTYESPAGFSPDERMLLTSAHGAIHLYEVATGRDRGPLRGHLGRRTSCCVAFSPDGRVLASGGSDTQVLVWDLTGRAPDGRRHPTRLGPTRMRELWEALAGENAARAYRAVWEMAADAEGSTAFLKENLHPVEKPRPDSVRRLLAQLDDDSFDVRQRAEAALAHFGSLADPFYREALAGRPSPEVRRRIERLRELADQPWRDPQCVREARAVETLEHIDTPAARQLVARLAEGLAEAPLTREARAARLRQDRRGR
jgi:hypothetical protein